MGGVLLCTLATSGSGRAEVEARVSAVRGDVTIDQEPVEQHGSLPSGKQIVAGPESSCSVVLARKAVVQFCGRTTIGLRERDGERVAVVDIFGGTSRTSSEPRAADEPLELHTEVAIATLVGTTVATRVDPGTGETTFAVEEGVIEVASSDPSLGPSVTVRAGEQVTIRRGEAPGVIVPIRTENLADLSECVGGLRQAAVRGEAIDFTDEVIADDLNVIGVGGEAVAPLPAPLNEPPTVCDEPWSCTRNPDDVPLRPAPPPACGGTVGDHCSY